MDKYIGRFQDLDGHQYEVVVTNTKVTSDATYDITLGEHPFVVNNDCDDSAVMPAVIRQTAKLTVIHRYNKLWHAKDYSHYHVKVLRDEKPVWLGRIIPDSTSQPWDGIDDEVTYNLVDELTAMAYYHADFSVIPNGMIIEYLADYFGGFEYVDDRNDRRIFVGSGVPTLRSDGGQGTILEMQSLPDNWQTEEDDEPTTTMEIIESWAALIGATVWSDGYNIYITTPTDTSWKAVSIKDTFSHDKFIAAWVNAQSTTISPNYLSNIQLIEDQTISWSDKAGEVRIECGGKEVADGMAELATEKLKREYCKNTKAYNSNGGDIPWKAYSYYSSEKNGVILYEHDFDVSDGIPTLVQASNGGGSHTEYFNTQYGAYILKEDYWATGDERDEGSGTHEDKRNYEFHDRIYLIQSEYWLHTVKKANKTFDLMHHTIDDIKEYNSRLKSFLRPLVELRSVKSMYATSGGLCIKMAVARPDYGNDYSESNPWTNYRGPLMPRDSEIDASVVCRLNVGAWWWNGREWVNNPSRRVTFTIDIQKGQGWQEVVNTKELQQPYTCTGYSIPIEKATLHGVVYFQILGVIHKEVTATTEAINYTQGLYEWVAVKDLELTYCPDISEELNQYEDKRIINKRLSFIGEDVKVESKMCTADQIKHNSGIVLLHGSPVKNQLEQETFDKLHDLYSTSRTYYEVTCKYDSIESNKIGPLSLDIYTDLNLQRIKEWDLRDGRVTLVYWKSNK